jgi:di/tricarboxylate transporter
VILALLVVSTSAMGMVLSNTATAVLVAPIAVRLASAFGIAPEPLLMGVAFGASAAFATPIASPVNVLVMTPGNYRFTDYTRVGLPLQVIVLTTAVVVIPLVWPF